MTFFDTHAHLNYESFRDSWKEVADRAARAGVRYINNIGTDITTWDSAVELAKAKPDNFIATLGVHPTHVHEEPYANIDSVLSTLSKLMKKQGVVAVGEAGLDYKHHPDTAELQKEYFARFIEFAREHNKTLVMHCRDAYEDFYDVLKANFKSGQKGVVHFYIGDHEMLKKFLDLGLYIGYTGVITYPKTDNYAENLRYTPADRIVIETDSPFAAPVPYRGRPNEPAYVVEVAKRIADVKGVSLDEVARETTANALALFSLDTR